MSWCKGLTKETDSRVAALSQKLMGHPNFNIEKKGCFVKGQVSPRKGTGKKRYWNQTEYHELRKRKYAELDYTCEACGKRGGQLNLHHLFPVSLFPDMVFDGENVMVLCVPCHRLTDTWGLRVVRKRGELRETLSEAILSQVREETLVKVQRLAAEANSAMLMPVIAATSAPPEREEIV